jgi:hypothetical protein
VNFAFLILCLGSAAAASIVGQFVVGPLDFSGDFGVVPVNSTNNSDLTTGGLALHGLASASFRVVADPIVIPDTDKGPRSKRSSARAPAVSVARGGDSCRASKISAARRPLGTPHLAEKSPSRTAPERSFPTQDPMIEFRSGAARSSRGPLAAPSRSACVGRTFNEHFPPGTRERKHLGAPPACVRLARAPAQL